MAGVGTRFVFADGVTTFTVIIIRILTATAAVLLIWLRKGGGFNRSAWRDGAIIGVLRVGLVPMLFISSLQYVSAGVEGIFITIIAASTAALAAAILHERLGRNQILRLAIGLVGSILIVAFGDSGIGGDGGNVRIGAMFALAGVGAAATSGVLSRKYAPRHRTTELATPMFISGAVVALVVGLVLQDIDLAGVTTTSWVVLIALGIGSTFIPFFATLLVSRHTSAARVALTGYLAPVVGVVAGVVLLGEVLTIPILIGAAFALIGVAVAGRTSDRHRTAVA
ncbi:MAG: DMT family transporter [Actinomycetota bacterium]|nr:DMT family transporter [Actinomycetota bacterium]